MIGVNIDVIMRRNSYKLQVTLAALIVKRKMSINLYGIHERIYYSVELGNIICYSFQMMSIFRELPPIIFFRPVEHFIIKLRRVREI